MYNDTKTSSQRLGYQYITQQRDRKIAIVVLASIILFLAFSIAGQYQTFLQSFSTNRQAMYHKFYPIAPALYYQVILTNNHN